MPREEQAYATVKKLLETKELNETTIVSIVVDAMEFVEKYKDLSGAQKKALVVRFIRERNPGIAHEDILSSFIDSTTNLIIIIHVCMLCTENLL